MNTIEKLTGDTVFLKWRETINDIIDALIEVDESTIPKNHASSSTTYGIGNTNSYGHVKVTDDISSGSAANSGIVPSVYVVKQISNTLTNLSTSVATSLKSKADKTHTHKNIVSSGRVVLIPSGLDASDTSAQIELEGCSVSEVYNDSSSPVSYGNIINVRGHNAPGGGQLLLEWKGQDSITGDLYYRSHRDVNSGGWGSWRKVLFSDSPTITGTAVVENVSGNSIFSTNLSATSLNVSSQTTLKNLLVSSSTQFNSGFTATGTCNVTGNVSVNGEITGNRIYNAVWNDYAEYFERGEDTEVGDIIALHPTKGNIYVKSFSRYCVVAGVHSDTYGMIIGGKKNNRDNYIPVGLKGRVYVKIKGKCHIGDTIVPSDDMNGVGIVDNTETTIKYIVGYVVEDIEGGENIRKVKILLK